MGRKKVKIVKFLETDEVKKFEEPLTERAKEILNNEEEMTTTDRIAIRDFAVINLVYACALRISEACNLEMCDLDLERSFLYVIDGKGGDRTVPIPAQTLEILKKWLEIRPGWKGNPYVFTNVKGTTRPGQVHALRPQYYNQLFKRLAEESGVKMRDGSLPHPHTLRHSRAMEIYDAVEDLAIVQAVLGHKQISTTQIYARVRNERVMKAQQTITDGLVSL